MTSQGLLAYTQIKTVGQDTTDIAFLLWKDRRSTATQSATYWGDVPCEKGKNDNSPLHTVARVFSTKTNGIFAPQTAVKQSKATPVKVSETMVLTKMKRAQGTMIVSWQGKIIYLLPVRFVPLSELSPACAVHGEPQWVPAKNVFAALESKTSPAELSVHVNDTVSLPLYLPFTTALRSEGVLEDMKSTVGEFGNVKSEEIFESKEELLPEKQEVISEDLFAECQTLFQCKACRMKLFSDKHVAAHEPASKRHNQFSKKGFSAQGADECSSIFLEHPLLGATPQGQGEVEGKLLCPKCSARLGSFNWSGAQCSCGKWVSPSFQVVKSKVDSKNSTPVCPTVVYSVDFPVNAEPA
jgi:hypothetical protein